MKGVSYIEVQYDDLISKGFNFDSFEYMANIWVALDKDSYGVIQNAKIIGEFAYVLDKVLGIVLIINLKESDNVKLEKIDRSNIN
jgi:hypothetical protein